MTTANMLTRVRTLLDESTSAMWSDTEIYSALADGQNAIIDVLIAKYKNGKPLHNLLADITVEADHTSGNAVPSGFIDLVGATVNGKNCEILSFQEYYVRNDNGYMNASANVPIAYRLHDSTAERIYFSPTTTPKIFYLKTPTDIASGQEPTLSRGHEAIVQYAFAFLLEKDEQTERSMAELEKFYKMVAAL